ncbi:uncharacterized protein LOC119580171 [Penaeus monodon]|uniref:uncharacterized protein LOC119580171 n=1 Tax=Penaeus monodon TaxID=6687 RepID=UPI0018A71E4B|nr:uncharacterized protein LOC119580171 [Penaeus monodon]
MEGEWSHAARPTSGEDDSEMRCDEGSRDAASPAGAPARHEEEALILTEAAKVVFSVAACLGLYVIEREGENCYRISKLKMIPALISFLAALSSLLHAILLMFFTEITYDQLVLFLPLFGGSCFCFYIYILWIRKSQRIMDYMTQLEVNAIKIPKRKNMPFIIAGVFIYSATYAAVAAVTLPTPSFITNRSLKYILFIPVFFTAFIPSFADIWVFSFLHPLVVALQGLARRARDVKVWTKEVSGSVMKEWLLLRRLLEIYNEVFSYMIHVRLLVFIVQTLTISFALAALRWQSKCLAYLPPLLVSVLEVVVRFLCISVTGDTFLQERDNVVAAVRERLCRPPSHSAKEDEGVTLKILHNTAVKITTEGDEESEAEEEHKTTSSVDVQCLHHLLSHMESRPLVVKIWGRGILCTRTYMRCLGIVATYLVILLQLRPQNQTGAEDERDLGIIQCFNSIKPFGRRIQCRVADPPSHM